MDTLRSVVHLQRELGDNLFNVLVSSDNTGAVRHFAEKLAQDTFPRKMIVGGCRYDILCFLQEGEDEVKGDVMVKRAVEMRAKLSEDVGRHILEHQADIPVVLRDRVHFVFTDWHRPNNSRDVYSVYWFRYRWVRHHHNLDHGGWNSKCRVLG